MGKARASVRAMMLALLMAAALALCALPSVAFAEDESGGDSESTATTYYTVANLCWPAEYSDMPRNIYPTNSSNPVDGTGTPTSPTTEATALLTDNGDGTYTLVLQLTNPVFTLQAFGTGGDGVTVVSYRVNDDVKITDGVTQLAYTRIYEVTLLLTEVKDSYTIEGCTLYPTLRVMIIEDQPLVLTVDFDDLTVATDVEEESHTYEQSWEWASDYSSAACKFTCTDEGCDDVIYVPVTLESSEEIGVSTTTITYTATGTYDGVIYTDTQTDTVENGVVAYWEVGAENDSDVIAYLYDDGTLKFVGSGDTADYTSQKSVPWYSYLSSITSYEFEDGVTPDNLDYYFAGTSITQATALPSTVTSLVRTFYNCKSLASLSDDFVIGDSVTTCSEMFRACTALASLPDGFAMGSSVTDCSYLFYGCTALTAIPDGFALGSSVTDCNSMFQGCSALTAIPEDFAFPDSVLDCSSMFRSCTGLTALPDDFEIGVSVTNCAYMFQGCSALVSLPEGFELGVSVTTCTSMFRSCTSLTALPESLVITDTVTNCAGMFYGCTSLTALPDGFALGLAVLDCGSMFQGCTSLASLPAGFVVASTVEACDAMFRGCTSLTSLPEGFSVDADDCSSMFYGCTGLTALSDGFTVGSSVEDCSSMFYGCTALASLPEGFAIGDAVTTCSSMFRGCTALASLPDGFSLGTSVTNCANMFRGCTALASLPEGFVIGSAVTDCSYMFQDCTSLISLPDGFALGASVTTASYMFSGCTSLASLPEGFTIASSVTTASYMFKDCTSLTRLPEGFAIEAEKTTSMFSLTTKTTGYSSSNLLVTYCSEDDYEALLAAYDWTGSYRTLTALAHDYAGAWTWASDYANATLTLTCEDCGAQVFYEATPSVETVYAAGCTEGGQAIYSVTYTYEGVTYSDSQTVEIAATGHTYDEGVYTDPTCTEDGYTTYTCTVCGDSYTVTDEGTATGHAYEAAVTTEPTCVIEGVTTYTCSVCGDSYTEAIAVVEHAYDEGVYTDPTCTEDGYTTYTCSVCGGFYTVADEGTATGHTYDEGVVTVEATATTAGVMTYTCTACGSAYTVSIPATGSSIEAPASSHTAANLSCDAQYVPSGMTVYTTTSRNPIEGTGTPTVANTEQTAVLTDNGDGTYTLVLQLINPAFTLQAIGECEYAEVLSIEYSDYLVYWDDEDAEASEVSTRICELTILLYGQRDSYEFTGSTLYATPLLTWISDVPVVLTVDFENAEAHVYEVDGESWAWADDYSAATVTLVCAECGYEWEADAAVTVTNVPATCTTDGSITYEAEVVYDSVTYSYAGSVVLEATGHTYDEGVVSVAATCETAGAIVYTCTTCGATLTESIAATGHDISVSFVWADDGSAATATVVCSAGDFEYNLEATVTSAVTTAATATADGVLTCTATVEVDGEAYTSTLEVAIAATGDDESEYAVIAGADQTLEAESGTALVVTANGELADFVELQVDGTALERGVDYTVASGSTVATLSADYLATLEAGEHTLTFVYTDGECSTTFTILASEAAEEDDDADGEDDAADDADDDSDDDATDDEETEAHTYAIVAVAFSSDYSIATITIACMDDGCIATDDDGNTVYSVTVELEAVVTSVTNDDGSVTYTVSATYDGVEYAYDYSIEADSGSASSQNGQQQAGGQESGGLVKTGDFAAAAALAAALAALVALAVCGTALAARRRVQR